MYQATDLQLEHESYSYQDDEATDLQLEHGSCSYQEDEASNRFAT
jgi:hypothetical protein